MRWLGGGMLLALLGCVSGDDQSDAAAQGALGGPCFSNDTCNTGLVCTLQNGKGVCEQSDATTGDTTIDQSNDTNAGDGTTSDASDAGVDAPDACSTTLTPTHACANVCNGSTPLCCESSGQCVSTASQCPNLGAWACQSRGNCSGIEYCCAAGVTLIPNCPPSAQMTSTSQAVCQNVCGSGTFATCLIDGDCPSTTPTCVGVQFSGVTAVLGICQ